MNLTKRQSNIIEIVKERNFISVGELSKKLSVSEMTIWRDLKKLSEANLIKRTFGGAVPYKTQETEPGIFSQPPGPTLPRPCESDVLVVTSISPKKRLSFLRGDRKVKPLILAEGPLHPNAVCCVGIDDYQAAYDLGCWVGEYAIEHWGGTANVLLWSYDLPNTEARYRGFLSGLNKTLPRLGNVTSLKSTGWDDIAYQLTRDALDANRNINVMFTINDNNAWGAIQACSDLKIDPANTIVVPFGLEGNTIKNTLVNNIYCPVGLAMFPEIVGQTLVDAAIAAYNHAEIPTKIETPYRILTRETLLEYYQPSPKGWDFQWCTALEKLGFSWQDLGITYPEEIKTPGCIGIYISFPGHEWYQNIVSSMKGYAERLGIEIEILDLDQSLRVELEMANHRIAHRAAQEIKPGDIIFISGDHVTETLTELIDDTTDVTVITNATTIFNRLEGKKNITLLSTGGILRRDSQALVGPIAEKTLNDIRVDKLFLSVSGVSLEFGLSHVAISEITIMQAMIRSAREVILLADHTKFEQESFFQIAPVQAVHKVISDSSLPESVRLQLNAAGIEVIVS